MELSPELLAKAKEAKSADEIIALAKENNIEITGDDAEKYYANLHTEGELADNELDNVAGGCGDEEPSSLDIDDSHPRCTKCGSDLQYRQDWYDSKGDFQLYLCSNSGCGKYFRRYKKNGRWSYDY